MTPIICVVNCCKDANLRIQSRQGRRSCKMISICGRCYNQLMRERHERELERVSSLIERSVSPPARDQVNQQLLRLAELTLAMNQKMNLTADDTPELFWPRHIEDSLWAA